MQQLEEEKLELSRLSEQRLAARAEASKLPKKAAIKAREVPTKVTIVNFPNLSVIL